MKNIGENVTLGESIFCLMLVKLGTFSKGCLGVILREILYVENLIGLKMTSLDVLSSVPITKKPVN